MELRKVELKNKKQKLILANGSERGDYIPLDYITKSFGKIHHGIQLMKAYYPSSDVWSDKYKVSEVTKKEFVDYAWDYEYEDYHPFDIFSDDSSTIKQFYDIKEYGSDIHLTLTLDLGLTDDELIKIVNKLKHFGRIFLRINHEANGFWFTFNQLNSYKEVSDFFVRFSNIIKKYSSNIYTIFSVTADMFVGEGIVTDKFLHLDKNKLREALEVSDYWSIDKYVSLHYGWPFEEKMSIESKQYFEGSIDNWWRLIEECYLKMIYHNNMVAKPLFINEFNADSNVDGLEDQGQIISEIYNRINRGEFDWLEGITLYQFRDHGGLGLEKGTKEEFEVLPSFHHYKKELDNFKYSINVDENCWENSDFCFSWENSDYIKGLKISNINEYGEFTNRFNHPIFIVSNNNWIHLNIGETFNLINSNDIVLIVPPFKTNYLNFRTTIRNIKSRIEEMLL